MECVRYCAAARARTSGAWSIREAGEVRKVQRKSWCSGICANQVPADYPCRRIGVVPVLPPKLTPASRKNPALEEATDRHHVSAAHMIVHHLHDFISLNSTFTRFAVWHHTTRLGVAFKVSILNAVHASLMCLVIASASQLSTKSIPPTPYRCPKSIIPRRLQVFERHARGLPPVQ